MVEASHFVILCVEDNLGDAELIRMSLEQADRAYDLIFATDGEQALDILFKRNQFVNSPTPGLIFLDLNLPKLEGREVLAKIKSDEVLKTIPIIVLSSSQATEDIGEAYALHANCFVTKPHSAVDFVKTIRATTDFWINVVQRVA